LGGTVQPVLSMERRTLNGDDDDDDDGDAIVDVSMTVWMTLKLTFKCPPKVKVIGPSETSPKLPNGVRYSHTYYGTPIGDRRLRFI